MATRHGYRVQDASLTQSVALPSSAGSAYTTAFDLGGAQATRDFTAPHELVLVHPALTKVMLPDTRTCTYKVQHSADNSSFTDLYTVLTQTGASCAGGAAGTIRVCLPTDVLRYVRAAVTTGSTTGDCSSVSLTATLQF